MQRLALGVAALLVVSAGSVATAAPSGEAEERDWCERNSHASATPEVEKERPVTAGGGQRNGKTPNAFTCWRTSGRAGDQEVSGGAVVNAWVDHENGVLRVNCVPDGESRLNRRCNQIVTMPLVSGERRVADADVQRTDEHPLAGGYTVDKADGRLTVSADVAGTATDIAVEPSRACTEPGVAAICEEIAGVE